MQRQLCPSEVIDFSIEQHLARFSKRSHVIYVTVIVVLSAGAVALPVIHVDVSVQSDGIVRPVTEKHEVTAPTGGFVETFAVRETQQIQQGQLLLRLRDTPLQARLAMGRRQLEQTRRFINDLELLTTAEAPLAVRSRFLETAKHRQEYVRFAHEFEEGKLKEERAARTLERSRSLYEQQLVSRLEVEDREFDLARIQAAQSLLTEEYQNAWQGALTSLQIDLDQMLVRQGQIEDEQMRYTVRSPVTGTLEQVAHISPGSYVAAGDVIAVISPQSELIAEVYVRPHDIGFLRLGTEVRMQIDAFNYTDWGFVTGRVFQIGDDFVLIDQRPVFRVRVSLDDTRLRLKNGYSGTLKKGMTLRARFLVTNRSLFQLLRDDVNDWLNPVQARESDR